MTDCEDWQKPVVFYDGGCPLCRREIMHYRRIDDNKQLCWIDIHAHPETLQACGLTLTDAMQRMHVMESDGRMVSGKGTPDRNQTDALQVFEIQFSSNAITGKLIER